jgi:FkbM family methyltransferase
MKYYSQYKQDEFIYNSFFKNKRDGVFLEIGADDGVRFSNCKFFEDHLNWKGIAVEARKEAYEKLKKNRNCICINCVLSDKEEETDFLELKGYGIGLSGLINKYNEQHKIRINQEIKNPNHKGKNIIRVSTKKLCDILEKHKIKNIDFLSIDTEGSELDILSTIDFDKYIIDVITIEDNYNDPKLMIFFKERGYEFVKQIKCDKIFKKIKL